MTFICCFIPVPPLISVNTNNVSLFTGQSMHLSCSAFGDPHPTIRWYKIVNNKRMLVHEIAGDRLVIDDGVMTLKRVTKEDGGKYVCVASNAAGERGEFVDVNVTGIIFNLNFYCCRITKKIGYPYLCSKNLHNCLF